MTRIILAASLIALSALPASAQMACGPRAAIVAALAAKYHETRSGVGLSSRGAIIELFVSEQGTWTMLLSGPGGMSCVVETGTNWEGQPPKVKGEDA